MTSPEEPRGPDREHATFSLTSNREAEAPIPVAGAEAGQVLGDFQLAELIGQGGMGQVWSAQQLSLQRRVALKLVRPDRVSQKAIDLFAREARAGGRLHHPGIVEVHGHGENDGIAWMAMEYVEGSRTLRDFLDETALEGELPHDYFSAVVRFVASVADAMHVAHQANVIHRDLKPQNILITPNDEPKVTDFGLARITDETALSRTGDFAGTYYYMSPEQAAAKRMGIDHRTDVFSLGVVLYEMLTHRRPFEGDTSHQVVQQILVRDPPDMRSVRSRIPRDLSVITGKALEKDPDRRYPTMAEFAADLRRHLANEPILAKPPGRLRKLQLWARRNPTKSVAGAVSLVAFVVVSLLLVENVRVREELQENADPLIVADLIDRARDVWPRGHTEEEALIRLDSWESDAREVLDRMDGYRELLEALADGISRRERLESMLDMEQALRELLDEMPARRRIVEERFCLWRTCSKSLAMREVADPNDVEGEVYVGGFGNLHLVPQDGLLPLGQDAGSGLWEFIVLGTGSVPTWDGEPLRGNALCAEDAAIVLVLVPGGRFTQGGQDVDLDPFFISKYEMTQAQWSKLSDGAAVAGGSGRFPQVATWIAFERALGDWDLSLPTEAQAEYACRAGTETKYWSGDSREDLARVEWYTDGVDRGEVHAVGEMLPNPFGLYDVHGNAWEWCQDWYLPYEESLPRVGDGLREHTSAADRVFRGGHSGKRQRYGRGPALAIDIIGVRPARVITTD